LKQEKMPQKTKRCTSAETHPVGPLPGVVNHVRKLHHQAFFFWPHAHHHALIPIKNHLIIVIHHLQHSVSFPENSTTSDITAAIVMTCQLPLAHRGRVEQALELSIEGMSACRALSHGSDYLETRGTEAFDLHERFNHTVYSVWQVGGAGGPHQDRITSSPSKGLGRGVGRCKRRNATFAHGQGTGDDGGARRLAKDLSKINYWDHAGVYDGLQHGSRAYGSKE
jgi:hypothetical protein